MRAGIDEVGTGALAGPVVVAVVAIEPGIVPGLRDSKLIAEETRYELGNQIRRHAAFYWTAQREADFVDKHGLPKAWLACMQECVHHVMLHYQSIEIVADNPPARWSLKGLEAVKFMPGGDDNIYEIQAASIVAKTHRDRIMQRLGEKHPNYSFEVHKGYATDRHIAALKKHGTSPVHRLSACTSALENRRPTETAFDRAKAEAIVAKLVPHLGDDKLVSDWEKNFVSDIHTTLKDRDLTGRQMYYLLRADHKISKRLKGRGAQP